MTIAMTGNLELLRISGNNTREELLLCWEQIVSSNSKASGDYTYDSYFQLIKGYAQLLANYTVAKVTLWKLAFVIDYDSIQDVRKRGFKIDLNNTEAYAASLTAALRKVNNLVTRATMKRKELEALQQKEQSAQQGEKILFEELLANLCAGLGFEVKDTITLAAFNAYRKIIKRKNEAAHGRRSHK